MRGTETVVFAFGALGETGKTAALTQRLDTVAALGQNLVRIGLMADVPDDAICGRIKNMMYCNGEFNDTQTRTEMAARHSNRIDRLRANLGRNLRQVAFLHLAKIGGRLD